jgi:hypothetical protein
MSDEEKGEARAAALTMMARQSGMRVTKARRDAAAGVLKAQAGARAAQRRREQREAAARNTEGKVPCSYCKALRKAGKKCRSCGAPAS